jgi:hypothetical protein
MERTYASLSSLKVAIDIVKVVLILLPGTLMAELK